MSKILLAALTSTLGATRTVRANGAPDKCTPPRVYVIPGQGWLAVLARGSSSGIRYRELAAAVRAAIASGELPVGAKLPPQRELACMLSISRTTVVSAYNLLRAEALVEMRQGAGTWVVRRP